MRKGSGWDLSPRRGLWERKSSSLWEAPSQAGRLARTEGSFRASEENAAAGRRQSEQGETSTNGQCQHPAVLSLKHVSTGVGWVLELGLQRFNPGRGLGLAV